MRWILAASLAMSLAAPAATSAATLIGDVEGPPENNYDREFFVDGDEGADRFFVVTGSGTWEFRRVTSEPQGQPLQRYLGTCSDTAGKSPSDSITCTRDNEVRVHFQTEGGNDHVELYNTVGLKAVGDLGAGNDTYSGPNAHGNIVRGGLGNDTLGDAEGHYSDIYHGDGGDDTFVMRGDNGDFAYGGDGTDTLIFGRRFEVVATDVGFQISLDGTPNDGEIGTDPTGFVALDVENISGNSGNDVLSGSGLANKITGGNGNDEVTGGEGSDDLQGGAGIDTIRARDGWADTITCGDGNDSVVADRSDSIAADCEIVDLPPAQQQQPPTDADGDGISPPADCNDSNAAIRPGAAEVPGNDVDENCDRLSAPFPLVTSPISSEFRIFRNHTVVLGLSVRNVPAGGQVEVLCKSSKCPFKRRKFTPRSGRVNLIRHFRNRKLRVGSTIEIRVRAPEMVGKVLRYTVRRGRAPSKTTRCLPPGVTSPQSC